MLVSGALGFWTLGWNGERCIKHERTEEHRPVCSPPQLDTPFSVFRPSVALVSPRWGTSLLPLRPKLLPSERRTGGLKALGTVWPCKCGQVRKRNMLLGGKRYRCWYHNNLLWFIATVTTLKEANKCPRPSAQLAPAWRAPDVSAPSGQDWQKPSKAYHRLMTTYTAFHPKPGLYFFTAAYQQGEMLLVWRAV